MLTFKHFALSTTILLLVSACGGNQTVRPGATHTTPPVKEAVNNPVQTTAANNANKNGKYYLDDGPGDNPPADIDAIPDATLKAEVPLERANRPYMALGKSYTPNTSYTPYKARGNASWYGKRYHGQKTASGEIYDMYGMTAAHTTLPLPSYARVTNPENGRSVVVRVNDRGPFHSDRIIDLSYAAAYKLRLSAKGSGLVEVEAIDNRVSSMLKVPAQPVSSKPVPAATPVATPVPAQTTEAKPNLALDKTADINNQNVQTSNAAPANGIYLQLGAFKEKANADAVAMKATQQKLTEKTRLYNWYNTNNTYRVWLGPYASRQAALDAAQKVKQVLGTMPIIINQSN